MNELILALFVFVLLHSVPAVPVLRSNVVALVGKRNYLVLYSLVSVAALTWLLHAALNSDYVGLWEPKGWQALVTIIVSPPALFLIVAGLISPNRVSISLRHAPACGAITAIARHPVLCGFILWSAGHIVVNGDLRSLILFGGLGLFSVGGLSMLDRRAKRRLGEDWNPLAASTSTLPFAAIVSGRASFRIDAAMVIAVLITLAMSAWLLAGGHAFLFGADPLSALNN